MNYCFVTKITESAPAAKKAVMRIMSPATGSVIQLSDAHSALYRNRLLGEGVGIVLTKGEVFAPFPLIVTAINAAKGSLTATTAKGLKLQFQIGQPEQNQHGERLQFHVKPGDKVAARHCLFTCDPLWMKQQGLSPCLYFTLLNGKQLAAIQCHSSGSIRALEEPLFTLFAEPG